MKSDEILAKLKAYADQEELEGQWGSYAGNNRCKTYGRLIKELDRLLRDGAGLPAGWCDVSPIVEMSAEEARKLAQDINFTPNLNALRVMIVGDHVKFKVNQYTWCPPLGKKA